MDLQPWVLNEGDVTEATGRVVSVDGAVRFEPALPRHLVYYRPGTEPTPVFSGVGVPVHGADLTVLERRFEKDGAVEGFASLRSTWDGTALHVADQRAPIWPEDTWRRWDTPPCQAPAGGWPHGRREENIDVPAELIADPAVVGVLMVRPGDT